jgi:hypothetical protein
MTVTGTIPPFLAITANQITVNQMYLHSDATFAGTYPITVKLWSTDDATGF